jgi:hypothetical protein
VLSSKGWPWTRSFADLHRRHRTLHIFILSGTGSIGRVLVCLSVREHWSSHWAGALEYSTLLY